MFQSGMPLAAQLVVTEMVEKPMPYVLVRAPQATSVSLAQLQVRASNVVVLHTTVPRDHRFLQLCLQA